VVVVGRVGFVAGDWVWHDSFADYGVSSFSHLVAGSFADND
jgi:hypothetical protein